MPINYKEYHPKWKKISLFIRKYRAKDRCEWCGRDNGSIWLRSPKGEEHECPEPDPYADALVTEFGYKLTKVVLTVAHIDHDKDNNSFFNLASLCQRCHLNHDRKQHALNRRNGRNWKRGQASLFAEA